VTTSALHTFCFFGSLLLRDLSNVCSLSQDKWTILGGGKNFLFTGNQISEIWSNFRFGPMSGFRKFGPPDRTYTSTTESILQPNRTEVYCLGSPKRGPSLRSAFLQGVRMCVSNILSVFIRTDKAKASREGCVYVQFFLMFCESNFFF
jgi:hypothetical protein